MTDGEQDTTLDQDRRTEGNCVCMYTVHCRVIVDKCENQQHGTDSIMIIIQSENKPSHLGLGTCCFTSRNTEIVKVGIGTRCTHTQ